MKRIILLLLALLLVTGLLTAPVNAQPLEYQSGDYLYTINEDETATMTGYTGKRTKLTLPGRLTGRRVTGIGDFAFSGNWELSALKLPEGLISIGTFAFYECSSLQKLTLPNSVTFIGDNPFALCPAEITVSKKHPTLSVIDGVLFDKARRSLISYPCGAEAGAYAVPEDMLSIGGSAFFECTSLKAVSLPEGLLSIGSEAFSRCTGLASLNLPGSLTDIGDYAFSECFSLSALSLPEGLKSIGGSAFSQCAGLSSLSLPLSLENMGENPFERCPAFIQVPPGQPCYQTIGGVLFDISGQRLISYPYTATQTAYSVPSGVRSIESGAFRECAGLKDIAFPQGLEHIGDWAFFSTGLMNLILPESLKSIGASAFSSCFELTEFTLPQGLESIGERAFSACYSLSSLTLPAGLKFIGEDAFSGCDALLLRVYPDSYAEIWADGHEVPDEFAGG